MANLWNLMRNLKSNCKTLKCDQQMMHTQPSQANMNAQYE